MNRNRKQQHATCSTAFLRQGKQSFCLRPPVLHFPLEIVDENVRENGTPQVLAARLPRRRRLVLQHGPAGGELILVTTRLCTNVLQKHSTRIGKAAADCAVVRALAFRLYEPGSTPGGVAPVFSHVGIVADDAAGRRVFSGISSFPRPCVPAPLYAHPRLTFVRSRDPDVKRDPDLSNPFAQLDRRDPGGRLSNGTTTLSPAVRKPVWNLPRKIGRVQLPNLVRNLAVQGGNAMIGAILARIPTAMADLAQAFTGSGISQQSSSCASSKTTVGRLWLATWVVYAISQGGEDLCQFDMYGQPLISYHVREWGKWEISEKTRRPAASSDTISTCENPGVTRMEIEPSSPCRRVAGSRPSTSDVADALLDCRTGNSSTSRSHYSFVNVTTTRGERFSHRENPWPSQESNPRALFPRQTPLALAKGRTHLLTDRAYLQRQQETDMSYATFTQNHEVSLVQHFYIGTKIKLDPGSELGSFDFGSGKMLVQPGISPS
ncbi:hypothetical protein PR048_029180 [Dryococelus australis]|uniref:Uncharacterized protein n=1 Tax=Dryococelus australis TaxID=614101 RepID=A0ABQ9GD94_9NEOP|nr:hypothetical protein PR048_029180 [Dryococelus australis]